MTEWKKTSLASTAPLLPPTNYGGFFFFPPSIKKKQLNHNLT